MFIKEALTACTIITWALLFAFGADAAADDQARKAMWEQYILQASDRWQKIVGKLPPLSQETFDRGFWDALYLVNPQPANAFMDLDDKVLDRELLHSSEGWMKTFFRKPIKPKSVIDNPPQKYYLPAKYHDMGLLLHKWKAGKYNFTMYETGCSILLRIIPSDRMPKNELTGKQLATIIQDVLVLDYPSDDKLIASFRLPNRLKPGDVFCNARSPNHLLFPGNWKNYILGFVTDADICLVCCKSHGGGTTSNLQFDRFWLNHGLFQKDGKTKVAEPPKDE